MSKARHAYAKKTKEKKPNNYSNENKNKNKTKKSIIKKFFYLLLILLVMALIAGTCYLGYKKYFINKLDTKTNVSEKIGQMSEIAPITESLKIKDAKYLEANSLKLVSKDQNTTNISLKIRNTSNETHKDIKFRLFLMNENKETITTLDYKIDNIDPNSNSNFIANIKNNLDNCKYYSISLKY